jgi:hypothetical protein
MNGVRIAHGAETTAARPGRETPARSAPKAAALKTASVTLAVIVIQFLMVTAYAWSAASTAPRNLPIAVTGPKPAIAALTTELSHARPGAFRVIPTATPAQAEADITSRVAYGAILLGNGRTPQVLIASAASPAVANFLTNLAARIDGTTTRPRDVTDIAPVSAADPTGAGFGFTVLPLMMSSLVAGALLSLLVRRTSHRTAALIAFGLGGGAVTTAVAHTWLGILPGSYLALASVTGLAALAVAAGVAGLAAIAGRFGRTQAGLGLGGALIMLVGNPFSGMSSAQEMLPGAWGMVGQYLPTGAAASLLRSVAYFDGARSAGPWTVLAVWATTGLFLLPAARPRRTA